jgi:hypothetical protein
VPHEPRRLTLTEAIESLRHDLEAAQRQGIGQAVGFSVEQVTVELDVEAEHHVTQEGGVSWYVTAKAQRQRTNRSGTRITVALKPHGTLNVKDVPEGPRDIPPPLGPEDPATSAAE